jgi:hypothetical protein
MRSEIRVMQVLRIPPLGKLVVEVNQKRYQQLADAPDQNVKRMLLTAIGELVGFAGGYDKLVEAGVAPSLVPATSAAAARSPAEAQTAREQEQTAFLASLEAERDALKNVTRPREPSVLARLQPLPQTGRLSPADSEINIVDQVDAILQRYLATDPDLAQRSIHLQQNPSGGLRIRVDGEYYQRPAEIKEPKIQILIKKALQEWEST